MQKEIRQCQNCKNDFIIEPEDFKFYEKIKVPPPTFCVDCKTIRRLCWRNEMSLFKRKCDVPGHEETIISFIHPDEKVKVYDGVFWWSDKWDATSYGKEYNFSKPFFTQWRELRDVFPIQCLSNIHATNSDYCNVAEESKDSYMSSASWRIEKTFYSNRISDTRECSDCYIVHRSELCYEDILCSDSYHLLYSFNCKNCVDSYFLYDCHGCVNCFGSTNLRNKSYCMWNEQLSKEEYNKRLNEINLKNYEVILKLKEKFNKFYLNSIHRYAIHIKTVNSTGDNIEGAKNCINCFDISGNVEDTKNSHWLAKNVKDTYDSGPGIGYAELVYECFDTGIGNYRNLFGSVVYNSSNTEYSINCHGCSDLFGCMGLRNKKYCILNKQYTKETFEELIPKIKQQMMDLPYVDKRGIVYKYGEFFPSELSTFCYNETQAQDYFPISKERALEMGYRWRDKRVNEYQTTLEAKDIPNNLNDVDDSIIKEVIGCENKNKENIYCRGAYRITVDELNLYRKIGVPLPHLCFFCRHEARLKKRNPMKLWHRKCMKEGCNNEFETSFAPQRPEIIYCEKCYNSKVY